MLAQEFDWESNNKIALTNSIYYALWGIKTAVESEVRQVQFHSILVWCGCWSYFLVIFLGYCNMGPHSIAKLVYNSNSYGL